MKFYIGTIELIFLLGPSVIVPLGIRLAMRIDPTLLQSRLLKMARWIQPLAALLVLISFAFYPGLGAGLLVLPWLAVCSLLGIVGLLNLIHLNSRTIERIPIVTAFIFIPVGGIWLAMSRFGIQLMGIGEPIVLLTAVHFHFTAFAAPLIAAGLGAFLKQSTQRIQVTWRSATLGLILGTPMVAIGFVYSPLIKIIAVSILVGSLMTHALLFLVPLMASVKFPAKILLFISGLSVWVGMVLAVTYAIGEFRHELILSIPQMGKTHGWLNGVGFSICGLLAWNMILSDSKSRVSTHN